MNKVVVANLNGIAYQIEEIGYHALRAYLDRAEAQLRQNPDRAEILMDLEQAIGEKCDQFLGAHKNVVSSAEIEQILREMGPVHDASETAAQAAGASGATAAGAAGPGSAGATGGPAAGAAGASTASESPSAPRRLYQIREGAMISGVCNGIAAYFSIDVTWVRLAFVILTFVTSGFWIIAYIVMMIVIPHANTTEEKAVARGLPFNAQELIDGLKKKYADYSGSREARRSRRKAFAHMRHETRAHAQAPAQPRTAPGYTAHVVTGLLSPVFGLVGAFLFVVFLFSFISMATTGAVLGWSLPQDIPLWAGLLILIAIYAVLVGPIRAARRASYAYGSQHQGWLAALDGLFWLGFTALFLWLGYLYVPVVRGFLQNLFGMWNGAWL